MSKLKKDIDNINTLLEMIIPIGKNQHLGNDTDFFINKTEKYLRELKAIKHKEYIKTRERKEYFKPLLLALEEKYKCQFQVRESEYIIEIMYRNDRLKKKMEDDESFYEMSDFCEKYLSEDDLCNLAINDDTLNEMEWN
ncbi:MAG: hypothetical protein ACRCVJ_18725 [Clostridium sp.]|uniref:hypothetical protein n=1 Tax=Clostridium sp. TaxID=1506 RepID=UPI003F3EE4D3